MDEATSAKTTLGWSHEDTMLAGGLLKFLTRVRKVCIDSEKKDVFFGSSITRITEHHIRPATKVEQLLAADPDDDIIWNNTDPCDVSLENISDSEEPVNSTTTPTSIEIENSNAT